MGNSEVGHLTIGSGRVVDQDLMRVSRAIRSGAFFENPALIGAFERARERGGNVHLIGLVSYGGVHSHVDHLRALLELARQQKMAEQTIVHAFTDGRDVSPHAAAGDLRELVDEGARIGTVVGRFYAMDRDGRWERTDRALAALVSGTGRPTDDPVAAVEASYAAGITDEFVEPVVTSAPRLDTGDSVVFFNFRPDRARQLSERLLAAGFDLTTMTRYRDDFDCPVALAEQDVADTIAEALAAHGLTPAPHRGDREVRARHVLPERRPGAGVARGGSDPRALAAGRRDVRRETGDVSRGGDRPARGRAPAR